MLPIKPVVYQIRESSLQSAPEFHGDREAHEGHGTAPAPSDTPGGYLNHPTLEPSGCTHHNCDCGRGHDYDYSGNGNIANEYDGSNEYINNNEYDGGNESDGILWTVVHPRDKEPHFFRVEQCTYWRMDSKQVWRHRITHFRHRYGWLCPNQTDTCPWFRGDFGRRDEVNKHCRGSHVYSEALRVNGGEIKSWGVPAGDGDLVPYDPEYHVPYRVFDGRIGRT